MSETDQDRLENSFTPYLKDTAGHYTYRVKGKEAVQEHLQQVGAVIHRLLAELKDSYAHEPAYQVLERIFTEHFNLVESGICPKENQELASGSLQSVDDQEGQDVKLIQTAISGRKPDPDKFHLADFDIHYDQQGTPTEITCPYGQNVAITPARTTGLHARFDPDLCSTCPFHQEGRCRAKPQKRDRRYLIAFTPKELQAAQRRKVYLEHQDCGQNLRAAVEATVRSVKHPFKAGKLPVRGQFRVSCLLIASAIHVNVRRICRYHAEHSFLSHFLAIWNSILRTQAPSCA